MMLSSIITQTALVSKMGSSTDILSSSTSSLSSLPSQLAWDGVAAAGTALAVAPLIAAFDEAITRSAAGENLWLALGNRIRNIVLQPAEFLRSIGFRWMWIVYAATYVTANGLKSVERCTSIQLGFLATLFVTLVNMSCGIAKDSAYATLFGTTSKQKTPLPAFCVWFLRDLVAFTFILTLPPVVAKMHPQMTLGRAKFLTPILAQYFTTPLHLLGFHMVNKPEASLLQQIGAVRQGFFSTVAARQMRILPPYSIGGVLNGWILGLYTGGAKNSP